MNNKKTDRRYVIVVIVMLVVFVVEFIEWAAQMHIIVYDKIGRAQLREANTRLRRPFRNKLITTWRNNESHENQIFRD